MFFGQYNNDLPIVINNIGTLPHFRQKQKKIACFRILTEFLDMGLYVTQGSLQY